MAYKPHVPSPLGISQRNPATQNTPLIYVAGPFSQGIVSVNVHNAIQASNSLMDLGFTPFCPHALTHLSNIVSPRPQADWLAFDQRWLRVCDAVLRLPGDSLGSDDEVRLAESLGIPVYTSIDALVAGFAQTETHSQRRQPQELD